MHTISVRDRRRALVQRHQLAGGAADPEAVARAMVALHATDPASVYLSVLARSATSTLADVSAAMYDRRTLVRWMAMRRTLFVFPREDIPTVQAAVSASLSAALRRRLISLLNRNGTDPPVRNADLGAWLAGVEKRVERAVLERGSATGTQLATDVPDLATMIPARTASERPHRLTTPLLTLMSAEGRLVRGTPTGAWTNRQHRWEPSTTWWPAGLPALDENEAQRELARRWLSRFGPATVEDLQWWTGWTKTARARALAGLTVEDVDLHGRPGIALAEPDRAPDESDEVAPAAALLPALDPTPMGWKHRDWYLSIDPAAVFDRAGNIGPTLWWDGEIIGSWAVTATGEVCTAILVDRGRDANAAVEHMAQRLPGRLGGAVVTPAARTPLEQELARPSH